MFRSIFTEFVRDVKSGKMKRIVRNGPISKALLKL
jgi:hypothetical protein